MIEITDSAARVIAQQLTKQQQIGGGLRIAVKAGGCSGFSYIFAWDARPSETTTRCSKARTARRCSSIRAA